MNKKTSTQIPLSLVDYGNHFAGLANIYNKCSDFKTFLGYFKKCQIPTVEKHFMRYEQYHIDEIKIFLKKNTENVKKLNKVRRFFLHCDEEGFKQSINEVYHIIYRKDKNSQFKDVPEFVYPQKIKKSKI